MAYDPVRDRITPTSSPYNATTSLPGLSGGPSHQTPTTESRRLSVSGYGGGGFSTPMGNGNSTMPQTHHGGGGVGQTHLSPSVTTPYNDSRTVDRSYFSLPIREHHPSLSAPLQTYHNALSPLQPNGHGLTRDLPTFAYPPAFSQPTNLGSVEMMRKSSSGSGGGRGGGGGGGGGVRSVSSGSNGSGFAQGGERGNGNVPGPGGPGMRSILNDQLPQPHIRHAESPRSSFSMTGTSPLSGQSALPGQGRYALGERRSTTPLGTPLGSRDRDSTTPLGINQLVTPSRNNSISLSMLLNNDSGSTADGKSTMLGFNGGRPTSSSSSIGGMGPDVVVQQVGGLDSLADAALALENGKTNGKTSGNGAINGIPKRARSRSTSPRFAHVASIPDDREVMSPTAVTPSASTDDMEVRRPSSSSSATLRRGSFNPPMLIPGAGAVTVDPAALEIWAKEKAKKKSLGKPRRESMVSPQREEIPETPKSKGAEKSRGKRKAVAVQPDMDAKPKDIDLTFSPESAVVNLTEESISRKRPRKASCTESVPSRRESLTKDEAASPDEGKNDEEEGKWSPSAPSASLIATDELVKPISGSRKISDSAAVQRRAREEVSPTTGPASRELGQTLSGGFAVPQVPVERKSSQPSRATPPSSTSRSLPMPYNPTHRVSRPMHMLKPITQDEIAWLRRQRRNPLARAPLKTPADGYGRDSVDSTPHDRVPSGDAGVGKRRRSSDASVEERRAFAEAPIIVKRQRDEEGNARVVSNQYEHHHVAAHYNSRRDLGKNAREQSVIFGLRKFNNWVKSVLIHRFACSRPESEGLDARRRPKPGRVLDIGCGKGGDLKKWDKAYIADYIGVDIAAGSIADAKARAASDRLRYTARFHVLDCFNEPLKKVLTDEEVAPLFDNVSMQFCIHYAFSDVGRVRLMLENASRYLRRGGVFFGTTLSDHKILQKLAEIPPGNDLVIQNDYYRIVFDEREHKAPFGHAYTFTLLDAINECKEYVVTWSEFESLAREYGFTCVYRKDFDELFEEEHEIPESSALAEKMGVTRGGNMFMNPGEWEAATMYMAFAFEQTREPRRKL